MNSPPASNDDAVTHQPPASNDDAVTHQQLYRAYLNFWNSLNNCVDDEYKIIPENGTRPTYREAKNLWKIMKHPRRRKLLWVATGYLHDEFPNDEAEFRREEEAGLIDETNVTTGEDAESSSDDDDDDIDIDLPDMNDENIPPVGAGAPQNALDRLYGGRPAEIQDISSDEEPPQDPINANAINDLELSLGVTLRPETPLAILEGALGDPDMSPVQAEIASTDNAAVALASPTVVVACTVPPVAIHSVADQLAAAEVGNEVVEDSQMDDCVDAFAETVQDDSFTEEPDLIPPRSLLHGSLQISALSDSPIPTSTVPKGIAPPKKRRIVETDDESDVEMKDFKPENDTTSYIDEQIAEPEQNQAQKSKPSKKGRKKKLPPKPSTSKPTPRVRTRSAIQADKRARKTITPRRLTHELNSDDSEDSVQSNNSVLGILDSDIVSDGSKSDLETSLLDGFIQPDDSVSEEESSDKRITMSDYQRKDPSAQSTLNDEIYTRNDSAERDLPAAVPRATVKNTPTTPKATLSFANLGKSRYSSDAPATTPRRPTAPSLSSKCGTFNQRRTTQAPVAQSRVISNSLSSRSSKAAGPVKQTQAKSVERAAATPAPTRQRQQSGDAYMQPHGISVITTTAPARQRQRTVPARHRQRTAPARRRQRTGESFFPYGSRPVEGDETTASKRLLERSVETFAESRQSRAKSTERNEAPGLSRQRQRSGETLSQTRGKAAERTDAIPAPLKRQSRGPSIQQRGPSTDSRRSTSSARFGFATRVVDDDLNPSRSSSINSINSLLPDGYEEIDKKNKRTISGILYIIHEINRVKYYRRYKPCGNGQSVFNSLACHDFYCVKCKIKGKDTLVKTLVKSNRIYAEVNHVPTCELKEYTLED